MVRARECKLKRGLHVFTAYRVDYFDLFLRCFEARLHIAHIQLAERLF